jgi:hypothetical protein
LIPRAKRYFRGESISQTWDKLKHIEKQRSGSDDTELAPSATPAVERRATQRLLVHMPVVVHGHGSNGEAFHEETEALSVNAGGALITLKTVVSPGQSVSLLNLVNQKEQKCQVVYKGAAYLETTVVGVGFPHPFHDFWT